MKGNSTSHLPYTWDKMSPPKRKCKEDGLAATRKHKKKATSGMESVAGTKAPARPYSDG